MNLEYGEAIGIRTQTLICPNFPSNAETVSVFYLREGTPGREESEEVRIVNFGVENLEKLLEIGVLEWLVRVAFLYRKKSLDRQTERV